MTQADDTEPDTHAPKSSWLDALVRPGVFAPLLAFANLAVSWWYLGYRFAGSDSGAILTNAKKILDGGVFYRDIDAYPFPGAPYLLSLALQLFGEHVTVSRSLAAVLFCITTLSLYSVGVRLVGRRAAALYGLSLLSFKFIAWPSFTAFNYWDTSSCFGVAAIALFMGHRFEGATPRLVASGFCVALALSAKQSMGLYLGFATGMLMLFPGVVGVRREKPEQRWSELLAYGGGVAVAVVPMLLFFAAHGLLAHMLYSGLIRPFTQYLPTSGISFFPPIRWWEFGELRDLPAFMYFPEPLWTMLRQRQVPGAEHYSWFWTGGELFSRTLYTALPVAFATLLLLWLRSARRQRLAESSPLWVFLVLATAVVITAFPRAGFTHVISVYPVVSLLLFALWQRIGDERGALRRGALVFRTAVVFVVLGLCTLLTVLQHRVLTYHLRLERADLHVAPDRSYIESTVQFLLDELEPGDLLFVYGHEAYYYFLTGHTYPWPFAQLYPGQAGGDLGRSLVGFLDRHRPKVVVRGYLNIQGVPPIPRYAPLLEEWVKTHFTHDWRSRNRYQPPGGWPREGFMTVMRSLREGERPH